MVIEKQINESLLLAVLGVKMEQVEGLRILKAASWFDKRCRSIIHSVFEKLTYGQLEIVEGSQHYHFPNTVNSDEIQGKIHIHDVSIYQDFIKGGSIGVAEAFIAGKWSSPNLTNVIRIFAKAQQQTDKLEEKKSWSNRVKNALGHWQNRNTQSGSKRNILAHYDLGNEWMTISERELIEIFMDKRESANKYPSH